MTPSSRRPQRQYQQNRPHASEPESVILPVVWPVMVNKLPPGWNVAFVIGGEDEYIVLEDLKR